MNPRRFPRDWNYALHPQPRETTGAAGEAKRPRSAAPSLPPCAGRLRNPKLTGMPEPALNALVHQLPSKRAFDLDGLPFIS